MLLEEMNIYDLRSYAREVGIKSPTTKRRDELITYIKDVQNGVILPSAPSSRGRPPRHRDDSKVIRKFEFGIFNANVDDQTLFNKEKIIKLIQAPINEQLINEKNFSGYYKKIDSDYGVAVSSLFSLDSSELKFNVILPVNMVIKYDIRDGDFVDGIARGTKNDNIFIASIVKSINGKEDCLNYERIHFEEIKSLFPQKLINIESNAEQNFSHINKISPICFGSRTIINSENDDIRFKFSDNILTTLNCDSGCKTLVISIDDSPEEISYLKEKNKNIEFCEYSLNETRAQFFQKSFLLISHYKRLFECGQKLVILFYNAEAYIKNLKDIIMVSYKMDELSAEIFIKNKIKDIMLLAKNAAESSLTFIAFNLKNQELIDMCNCYIELNCKPYEHTNVYVNVLKSYTKNLDKIFNLNYLRRIIEFKQNFNLENAHILLENLLRTNEDKDASYKRSY